MLPASKLSTVKVPAFVAFLLALFGAGAAQAADIDFGPFASAAVTYLLWPLAGALVTWLVSHLVAILKVIAARYPAYIDQKTAALLAQNVDAVLQKAISFGAAKSLEYIGDRNLHTNVNGWVASYAADYAVQHAPDLMKQAGDIGQKIIARLDDHPAVQELKASVAAQQDADAPLELHPAA